MGLISATARRNGAEQKGEGKANRKERERGTGSTGESLLRDTDVWMVKRGLMAAVGGVGAARFRAQ